MTDLEALSQQLRVFIQNHVDESQQYLPHLDKVDWVAVTQKIIEPRVDYDPVGDEQKQFTLAQFATALSELADAYRRDFEASGVSEFMKTAHTFDQWMRSFRRWASW